MAGRLVLATLIHAMDPYLDRALLMVGPDPFNRSGLQAACPIVLWTQFRWICCRSGSILCQPLLNRHAVPATQACNHC